MKVFVFGLDDENQILSRLRKRFPSTGFQKYDKSIDLEEEGPEIVAIDTVKGLGEVALIEDINELSPSRSSEMLMTLRIMIKIGSLKSARIIAVPPSYDQSKAVEEISAILTKM